LLGACQVGVLGRFLNGCQRRRIAIAEWDEATTSTNVLRLEKPRQDDLIVCSWTQVLH
jgi:predicted Fe-S protein YdhL (DUF1289 family)